MRLFGRIGQALIEAKQSGPRSVRRHRGRHVLGMLSPRASPKRSGSRNRGLRFPAPHRRELRHAAPLRAGISRRVLKLRAAPAADVLDAIEVLRSRMATTPRKVPPTRRPSSSSRAGGSW
ncbi:hypothetical protein LNP20_30095 [Klebsiella pneumoniae subsp. pneumoniae]|nr:hypothetical protein [Klebsiella pneumoniae subsp. pneumoniae]